jgi:hypothetical protein
MHVSMMSFMHQWIEKFQQMLNMLFFLTELRNLQNQGLFRLDKPMHHPKVCDVPLMRRWQSSTVSTPSIP